MPRPISFLAGAWLLALAPPAFAQTDTDTTTTAGSLVVRALSVGGEEVKLGDIPIGIAECKADADIVFEIDGVPEENTVDVYLGEACNQPTSRDSDTNSNCDYVGNFPSNDQTRGLRLTIKTTQLIDDCDEPKESTPKIWFLAVTDPGKNEDVDNFYGTLTEDRKVRLDTRAPSAPTMVEGGTGEKQIPVSWDAPGSDLEGFIVLIDQRPTDGGGSGGGGASGASGSGAGGDDGDDADQDGGPAVAADGGQTAEPAPTGGGSSSDGECGSSVLTPNGSAANLGSGVKRKEVNEATATGIDLSPNDIGGEAATVAVVAVDEAGNESPISELVCVRVVPTESFWDRYQGEDDAVEGGCPCTALGPAQLGSAWPVALSLWFVARSARRRRRS
jgi:hypothetical protein